MTSIRVLAPNGIKGQAAYQLSSFVSSINGSIAGGASGFLTTPLDVLKTRQMTFQKIDKEKKAKQMSTTQQIQTILKTEGISGFFRGAIMRTLYLTVGGFVFFGVYENCRLVVEKALGV